MIVAESSPARTSSCVGPGRVAPDLPCEAGGLRERAPGVPLDLHQGDGPARQGPVREGHGVEGVFPPLVDQAADMRLVPDEAVLVEPARSPQPPDGRTSRRLDLRCLHHVPGSRGQRDEEQRSRVDSPVVPRVREHPERAGLRAADLVDDLARLCGPSGVVVGRLCRGERADHRGQERRPFAADHERGEDRVSTEEREEPRRPRGRDRQVRQSRAGHREGVDVGERDVGGSEVRGLEARSGRGGAHRAGARRSERDRTGRTLLLTTPVPDPNVEDDRHDTAGGDVEVPRQPRRPTRQPSIPRAPGRNARRSTA